MKVVSVRSTTTCFAALLDHVEELLLELWRRVEVDLARRGRSRRRRRRACSVLMSKFMCSLPVSRGCLPVTAHSPSDPSPEPTGALVAGTALVDARDHLEALHALLDELGVRVVGRLDEELLVGLDAVVVVLRGLRGLRDWRKIRGSSSTSSIRSARTACCRIALLCTSALAVCARASACALTESRSRCRGSPGGTGCRWGEGLAERGLGGLVRGDVRALLSVADLLRGRGPRACGARRRPSGRMVR